MEEWFYKGIESGVQDLNYKSDEKRGKSSEGKRKRKTSSKKKRLWRNPERQVPEETFETGQKWHIGFYPSKEAMQMLVRKSMTVRDADSINFNNK